MTDPWFLIADIGGTNARFAAFQHDQRIRIKVYDTKQDIDLLEMARQFCKDTFPEPPTVCVVAAAGPVKNNALRLTNANKSLCGADLKMATGAQYAHIINDFAAAAWSTLALEPKDISLLSGQAHSAPCTRLVIGPGTGLGVGALVYSDGKYHSVSGEGGHVGASPRTRYEVEVFEALKTIWPEVFFGNTMTIEIEAILSGTGLPALYQAIQKVEGKTGGIPEPRRIFEDAQHGADPLASKTINIFKSHLGQVAGDLGLAYGASNVFLVGGMAQKNAWMFDREFIAAFHAGGRFTKQREAVGLYLVSQADFGLIGAYKYAVEVTDQPPMGALSRA